MKKKTIVILGVIALAIGGSLYGYAYSNSASESCPLAGTADCPEYQNCPKKGRADCPLILNCPKKGTADCPYTSGKENCCEKSR